jgi:single-strand DNA-binding protein
MVNRVILIGNLGRDPEVRTLESGAKVAKFSIATNESYRDKNGEWVTLTEWHDIVLWRNMAERAERDLKKGASIYLEGKLTHRKWQDQDGNKRKTTEVVGSYFRIIKGKSSSEYFPSQEPGHVAQDSPEEETPEETKAGETKADQDDLPF